MLQPLAPVHPVLGITRTASRWCSIDMRDQLSVQTFGCGQHGVITLLQTYPQTFTVSNIRVFQGNRLARLNVKAWNDKGSTTLRASFLLVFTPQCGKLVQGHPTGCIFRYRQSSPGTSGFNRSTGGHEYWRASGEILRPLQD